MGYCNNELSERQVALRRAYARSLFETMKPYAKLVGYSTVVMVPEPQRSDDPYTLWAWDTITTLHLMNRVATVTPQTITAIYYAAQAVAENQDSVAECIYAWNVENAIDIHAVSLDEERHNTEGMRLNHLVADALAYWSTSVAPYNYLWVYGSKCESLVESYVNELDSWYMALAWLLTYRPGIVPNVSEEPDERESRE